MIEWIHLKNFQNHEDTRIDFVLGLNVIAGGSDQGKSAVLRALEWVRTNRPTGTGMIMDGAKKCTVTIKCSDAPSISRVRSSTDNYYMIGTKKLKAVGTGVPSEVEQILGMNDVNIANQFEEYFLLQKTPGEVAKYINQLTNLDIIDMVFLETKRRTLKVNAVIEDTEIQIKANEEALKDFEHLEASEALIDQLEEATDERGRLIGRKARLSDILSAMEEIDRRIEEYDTIINMHNECSGIMETGLSIKDDLIRKNRLSGVVQGIEDKQRDIDEVSLWLKIIEDVKPVTESVELLSTLKNERINLRRTIEKLERREDKIKKSDIELKTLTKQKDTLISKVKICPFCERVMNET